MLNRCLVRLRPLCYGGVTLGLLQAIPQIDFNGILFQFLNTLISLLVAILVGGDAGDAGGGFL